MIYYSEESAREEEEPLLRPVAVVAARVIVSRFFSDSHSCAGQILSVGPGASRSEVSISQLAQ